MTRWLAALAVPLAGCMYEYEGPRCLRFDERLSSSAVEHVLAAADWWNDTAGSELFTTATSCDGPRVVVSPLDDCSEALGRAEFLGWHVWLCDDRTQPDGLFVAAHELGHILGLPHSFDADNLMWPYANQSLTVTPEQVEEVRNAR